MPCGGRLTIIRWTDNQTNSSTQKQKHKQTTKQPRTSKRTADTDQAGEADVDVNGMSDVATSADTNVPAPMAASSAQLLSTSVGFYWCLVIERVLYSPAGGRVETEAQLICNAVRTSTNNDSDSGSMMTDSNNDDQVLVPSSHLTLQWLTEPSDGVDMDVPYDLSHVTVRQSKIAIEAGEGSMEWCMARGVELENPPTMRTEEFVLGPDLQQLTLVYEHGCQATRRQHVLLTESYDFHSHLPNTPCIPHLTPHVVNSSLPPGQCHDQQQVSALASSSSDKHQDNTAGVADDVTESAMPSPPPWHNLEYRRLATFLVAKLHIMGHTTDAVEHHRREQMTQDLLVKLCAHSLAVSPSDSDSYSASHIPLHDANYQRDGAKQTMINSGTGHDQVGAALNDGDDDDGDDDVDDVRQLSEAFLRILPKSLKEEVTSALRRIQKRDKGKDKDKDRGKGKQKGTDKQKQKLIQKLKQRKLGHPVASASSPSLGSTSASATTDVSSRAAATRPVSYPTHSAVTSSTPPLSSAVQPDIQLQSATQPQPLPQDQPQAQFQSQLQPPPFLSQLVFNIDGIGQCSNCMTLWPLPNRW